MKLGSKKGLDSFKVECSSLSKMRLCLMFDDVLKVLDAVFMYSSSSAIKIGI